MARRPPASANPASVHFLAKPHFHPNVTFGDFTGTHPRARIGFRREFLPRTSEVRRTNHNHFLVVFLAVQIPFILLVLPSFAWRTIVFSFLNRFMPPP